MISILISLFKRKGYSIWLAGQICFGLSSMDVIAVPAEDKALCGDVDYEISWSVAADEVRFNHLSSPNPPEFPFISYYATSSRSPNPAVYKGLHHEIIVTNRTYQLYLLKRPPPSLHNTL